MVSSLQESFFDISRDGSILMYDNAWSQSFPFRIPRKERLLVDRHAAKNVFDWLQQDQEGKVCRFTNDSPQHMSSGWLWRPGRCVVSLSRPVPQEQR